MDINVSRVNYFQLPQIMKCSNEDPGQWTLASRNITKVGLPGRGLDSMSMSDLSVHGSQLS